MNDIMRSGSVDYSKLPTEGRKTTKMRPEREETS